MVGVCMEMKLGLAGTAKNTGKTTTTAAIIEELRYRSIPFYLTSIGYDGETIDNITGLAKPKLRVEPGDMVVTAEKCFLASTAGFKILHMTSLQTPLGRIGIAKVLKGGLVVTAGPNKTSEVKALGKLLFQFGPGICIFDGALSRIAPMAETQGFVLATGAAKSPDIARVAAETEMVWHMANLPQVPRSSELKKLEIKKIGWYSSRLETMECWEMTSLLSREDVNKVTSFSGLDWEYLYIPGVASVSALETLAAHFEITKSKVILCFTDPMKCIVVGETVHVFNLLRRLEKAGVFVGVLTRVPLIAVTVNPFYPEYRVDAACYQPAFVDVIRLQVAVQKKIHVPVYNVLRQGAVSLVDEILKYIPHTTGTSFIPF